MNQTATHTLLTSQRHLFNLPENVAYLNCAYMGPNLKSVEQAGVQAVKQKNLPFTVTANDFYAPVARLEQTFARLINCAEPQRIVLVPSVSYGLANVANNLPIEAGQHIVMAHEQFPSNVYTWQALAQKRQAILNMVHPPEQWGAHQSRGQRWNERLLEAIGPKTRLVALAHTHWADGTLFDLPAIRQRCNEVGALMVIDGTQSVGALPFDVQAIQPDALVCGGYKWLLGPYSLGLAYYGPAFDNGTPIEENWINRLDSQNFAGLVNYQHQYQPLAQRYAVGEHSNFALVPMLQAALDQLAQWKPENIQAYAGQLQHEVLQQLQAKGFWVETPQYRGNHLVGIRTPKGYDIEALKAKLEQNNVYVSVRGQAIRVSFHLFNDANDVDRLLHCIE